MFAVHAAGCLGLRWNWAGPLVPTHLFQQFIMTALAADQLLVGVGPCKIGINPLSICLSGRREAFLGTRKMSVSPTSGLLDRTCEWDKCAFNTPTLRERQMDLRQGELIWENVIDTWSCMVRHTG